MMNNDPNEVIHGLASTLGDDEHGIVKESLLTLEKMLKNRQTAQRFHPIVAGSNPLIHALVGATLRAFQVLAPESGETQQALEEAVERAQKSATILRILAEPQKDVPNREKQQNQIHACSGIVHNHGASVLTMLLPYENPRIRNNCVVTIHTLLEALKHDKQQYEMNDLLVVVPGMFAGVDLQQLLQVLRRPGEVPLLHLHRLSTIYYKAQDSNSELLYVQEGLAYFIL